MDEYDGFTLRDAETVKAIYACSQCEGELAIVPSFFSEYVFFVICQEHGNVELIGRISKTTVAIRNERGVHEFLPALRALPDLWGDLLNQYMESRHTPLREGETKQQRSLRELGFPQQSKQVT